MGRGLRAASSAATASRLCSLVVAPALAFFNRLVVQKKRTPPPPFRDDDPLEKVTRRACGSRSEREREREKAPFARAAALVDLAREITYWARRGGAAEFLEVRAGESFRRSRDVLQIDVGSERLLTQHELEDGAARGCVGQSDAELARESAQHRGIEVVRAVRRGLCDAKQPRPKCLEKVPPRVWRTRI